MAPPRRTAPLLDDAAALANAYQSATIAELAGQLDVSSSTVRRALVRHGISRRPRNRNRRPGGAEILDDPDWLTGQYRTRTGVDIAEELGVSPRTVYAAMERHGIERRSEPGATKLKHPELADHEWLATALERGSSSTVAAELNVSAGTVTAAYERAGIDPASTTRLYERGRRRDRPSVDQLQALWDTEGSFRGVARRLGIGHTTAAVWLAEVGIFAGEPALSRSDLLDAIRAGRSIVHIADEHGVATVTVRVELHRHGLFEAHRQRHTSSVGLWLAVHLVDFGDRSGHSIRSRADSCR